MEHGENAIRITVRNSVGETARDLLLSFAGKGPLDKRGTLYILAVGVNSYTHFPHAALRFAGADARAFEATMRRYAGPLHERVESMVLATGASREPTRANIEDALTLFRDAQPEDTVMVFLAGHGTNEDSDAAFRDNSTRKPDRRLRPSPDYLFIPQDAASESGSLQPSTVLRWHVVQNALQNARGRRLLFVDTCHSGGAYNPRLVKDAHDAQIILFSASDSDTPALEMGELGHGAFTFALKQGVEGGAALGGTGDIRLLGLGAYVAERVATMTGGSQEPAFSLSGVKDFVLARCGT